jgi:hypothetical protein
MRDLRRAITKHSNARRLGPTEPQRVFLVPVKWYETFKTGIGDAAASASPWEDYAVLFDKRASRFTRGQEFEVVPYDLLPRCIDLFGLPPRDLIVRYWDGIDRFFPVAVKVPIRESTNRWPTLIETTCNPHAKCAAGLIVPPGGTLFARGAQRAIPIHDGEWEIREAIAQFPQPWELIGRSTQEPPEKNEEEEKERTSGI